VFNNLYVYVEGMIAPRKETLPRLDEDVQIDGNAHYDVINPSRSVAKMETYRASPFFEETKSVYPPGWEANARVGDARFVSFDANPWVSNDYRIQPGSVAACAGVPLPPAWPDSVNGAGAKPDAGAIPLHGEPFRPGREIDADGLKIMEWLEKAPRLTPK
jgi:hypothetical protein